MVMTMEKYCRFLFTVFFAFAVFEATVYAQTYSNGSPITPYQVYYQGDTSQNSTAYPSPALPVSERSLAATNAMQSQKNSPGPAYDYNYQFYNHRDANGRVLFPRPKAASQTVAPTKKTAKNEAVDNDADKTEDTANDEKQDERQYLEQHRQMIDNHVNRRAAGDFYGYGSIGSSIPNMIGDSTSMPTKLLTYSFRTTKEVLVPNPNYVPWPEDVHTDVPKGNGLSDGVADSGGSSTGTGTGLNVNDDLLPYGPETDSGGNSTNATQEGKPSRDQYIVVNDVVRETIAVPMPVTPTMFVTTLNIAENFNAEVQDRFYIDLRYFGGGESFGVASGSGGVFTSRTDMSRMSFGIEKKIGQRHSLEMRLPVVLSGLKSSQNIVGNGKAEHSSEFGNLSIVYKNVWRRTPEATFCWGIGINTPTAPNMKLKYQPAGGADLISGNIENRKVSLIPYVGFEWNRDNLYFGHLVAQADVALGENRMDFTDRRYGLTKYKTDLKEYSLLRFNIGTGRWLYQNPVDAALFKLGIMAEFHFTTNIDVIDPKIVYSTGAASENYFVASTRKRNWSNINIVFGIPIHTRRTTLTTFLGVPITNTRYYDIEGGISADIRF